MLKILRGGYSSGSGGTYLTYHERGISLLYFVLRVARNVLVDYYRREQRKKVMVSLKNVLIADQQPGLSELVSANHERQELLKALDHLKEDHRTVLVLRYLSELSPYDTAQAMGRSSAFLDSE